MCDIDHFDQDAARYSRRDLGALALGAGLMAALPAVAQAVPVTEQDVIVPTPDGRCDAYFVAPTGKASAAVLLWPDIFGLRPAFRAMGRRLAESGYAVLVVNPFYRLQPAPTAPQGAATPIAQVVPMMQSLTPAIQEADARAFIAWLDARPEVDRTRKIGTTGYCMGGPIVMRTAAAVPERVGAGASFHGANLANATPDSPHRLAPRLRGHFLIAIAENDDQRDPAAKDTLRQAFTDARVPAEIEVYPAAHGWCPPDTKVHDPLQAERAWQRLLVTLKAGLG